MITMTDYDRDRIMKLTAACVLWPSNATFRIQLTELLVKYGVF